MENSNNLQDLGGYDMVISITQRTINTQLNALFRRNRIFPGKVIRQFNGKSFLAAKVNAPVLSLEGNSPEAQKIYLTISFPGGEFSHEGGAPFSMTDRQVTFETEVKMREVDQDYIRNHRNLEEAVKTKMEGFTPDNFRISKLFLALKGRNELHAHIDKGRSNLPAMNAETFRSFADTLEKFLVGHIDHDHNPMLLGFMPTHRDVNAASMSGNGRQFLPTGVRFSVTQNLEDGNSSLLNYMFMTQHREFPTGTGAGVILTDETIKDPIYRVSHSMVAGGLVIDEIKNKLATPSVTFANDPDPWKAMGKGQKTEMAVLTEGDKRFENTHEDQNQLTVTFSNTSHPQYGDCAKIEARDVVQRKATYSAHNYRPGRNYSPLDCTMSGSFRLFLTAGRGKLVVHRGSFGNGVRDGNRTMEYYRWVLDNGTPFDIKHYQLIYNYFSSWVDGPPTLKNLELKLAEDMVVPATGNIFTMSKVRFALAVPGKSLINLCKTLAYRRPS